MCVVATGTHKTTPEIPPEGGKEESNHMMNKRHYEAIADVLHDAQGVAMDPGEIAMIRVVALGLATQFAGDNPDFNRDKFLKKCGITL